MIEYPSPLALPRPRLLAYHPETAIAEKLHAMVVLGAANSRLEDFFDVHVLATRRAFERRVLAAAVANTFARRATAVPYESPIALTREFAAIPGKRVQWDAFNRRSLGSTPTPDLAAVIDVIAFFAGPVLAAVARGDEDEGSWAPGGPWR